MIPRRTNAISALMAARLLPAENWFIEEYRNSDENGKNADRA